MDRFSSGSNEAPGGEGFISGCITEDFKPNQSSNVDSKGFAPDLFAPTSSNSTSQNSSRTGVRGPAKILVPSSGASTTSSSERHSPNTLKARRKQRKNDREKQRRLEINAKIEQLAQRLGMTCEKARSEKYNVLAEAHSVINALRLRNKELRGEKSELRTELMNLTRALQIAFPPQPPPTSNSRQTSCTPQRRANPSPVFTSAFNGGSSLLTPNKPLQGGDSIRPQVSLACGASDFSSANDSNSIMPMASMNDEEEAYDSKLNDDSWAFLNEISPGAGGDVSKDLEFPFDLK
eukprot:CAMPEP_0185273900 /NCGR_PEP_ID=MMETSP1359-20130426/50580_1 /TAXON_ID=552665 /ORGANISM="Bigelowiella longifila, Strain CCMP242" /LENGTH=291 /DNA_ID=CAMNT_0027866683 /DNA_START=91 /DNA_END=966 /DNA_ORIENTATION=-